MGKCLKVSKRKAETARKKLVALDYLDRGRKIASDKSFVYLPFNPGSVKSKISKLGSISSKTLSRVKRQAHSISELLSKKLSKKELKNLKTAFDIFGDVIVVEIPPELEKKEKLIGAAFLKLYKNVRAVFKKKGRVEGVERIRSLKRIAGTGTAIATYKEHGCTFKFNISKVFFSPRLSTERGIIAEQVKSGEVVLDMFAGVGPFSIIIAKKHTLVKKIYALDINKNAISALKENAELNKVSDKIEAQVGDACLLIPKKFKGIADRVIMNLPKTGVNFLPTALKALKPSGGVIHYYTFKKSKEEVKDEINKRFAGKKYKILEIRNVKPYAPREYCFAADIKIYK